jgi:hypothetical protein
MKYFVCERARCTFGSILQKLISGSFYNDKLRRGSNFGVTIISYCTANIQNNICLEIDLL